MAHDEPKPALLKLQLAFRAAPQDTETLTLLAQVFEALDQIPKAIAVLHELGAQARQRNQALAAERITAHILRLDPEDKQAQAWAAHESPARNTHRVAQKERVLPPLPQMAAPHAAPGAGVDKFDLTHLLVEASVFARYGLRERALEYLNRVLTAFPDHAGAQAQYASLMQPASGMGAPEKSQVADTAAETATSIVTLSPQDDQELVFALDDSPQGDSWGGIDLDALIAELIPDETGNVVGGSTPDQHIDAFLSHAQAGMPAPVAAQPSQVEASDFDTQYNLGIAYREMGLFGDAIGQFKRIVDAPGYAMRALTMLGLCYFQAGKTQEALDTLGQALALPNTTAHERAALHYEMATAYDETGDAQTAQQHFMQAHTEDPTFRDVASRITR
jgi:tetratricopeptide (TPR) repeat protein